MKDSEKKWIIGLIIVAAIIIVVLFVFANNRKTEDQVAGGETTENEVGEKYTTELEDGTKINTSEELNNTKTYNGLEISNIQFTERDGMSVLLADVKNTNSTKHELEIVKINILGENGEVITDIEPIIGEIEPGETIKLNASITGDVTNARDFTIEAK